MYIITKSKLQWNNSEVGNTSTDSSMPIR